MISRITMTICALFIAGAVAGAKARAATGEIIHPAFEVCPVYEGDMGRVSPSVYGFDLKAPTARTASGTLAIETNRGWYRFPFGPVTLSEGIRHFTDGTGYATTDNSYRSTIFFVDFGQAVDIWNWWVEKARSDTSDWKAHGDFSCYPPVRPDPSSPYYFRMSSTELVPYTVLPTGTRPSHARAVPPIERADCAKPFADASIVKPVTPRYPFDTIMPAGIAVIAVTILPDGTVGNATVYQSSGVDAYDIAAMEAARQSTYSPRIAYCRPTVGTYLFKVTFNGK